MGTGVFSGCTGLQQVIIKDGCSVISENCFNGCSNIQSIVCYCVELPTTASNAFPTVLYSKTGLYVPEVSYNLYKETEPWSKFLTIGTIEGGVPDPDVEKCATPQIAYESGQLRLTCATAGVKFVTDITDTDIRRYDTDVIDLTVTYTITVYATKEGYDNSDTVTGTLCWIDQQPSTEGIVNEDAVTEVKALPVLIQSNRGTITVQGANEGTEVSVFSVNGMKQGSAIATNGLATIYTSLHPGSTAIVKIGEKAIKVMVK